MNKECEIVRDLLPLYIDDACSASSVEMIEAHLPECDECTRIHQTMKTDHYEEVLKAEKDDVIAHHAKTQTRKTLIVGAGIAGVLCIPIIVCLIVNLAVGHALSWFFIVLTSLFVFASLTVVPLVVEKQRGPAALFSFTISLLLLLLTCAIYTHGRWFMLVATSVIFGLSVVFMPYVAYAMPLSGFWKNNKGLLILGTDTILFTTMMLCIGFYNNVRDYWHYMPPLALFNAGFIWIIFLVCRYLKTNKFIRAGISSIITGAYIYSADNVINLILGERRPWPKMNLGIWSSGTVDGNIKCTILFGGILIGVICIVIGIKREKGKKEY